MILLVKPLNDVAQLAVIKFHVEENFAVRLTLNLHLLVVVVFKKLDLIELNEHLEFKFVHLSLLVHLFLVLFPDLLHLHLQLLIQLLVVFLLNQQVLLQQLDLLFVLFHL